MSFGGEVVCGNLVYAAFTP
ncbi:DUF3265 domain-containing protein [Vibrio parahaemolyticus]|nr:DUF3265 domain-containing protein [Vibrio parahaemolyticus]